MESQMVLEELEKLGLDKGEIKVYLLLLRMGSSLAGKIAQKSELNRTHIYDTLNKLIQKNYATYFIKNNRKYFKATSPLLLREKVKELEHSVENIIPQLMQFYEPELGEISVELYHGKEGIKTILNDILNTSKEYLVLGSPGKALEILSYYTQNFHTRRLKENISIKIIYQDSKEGRERGKEVSKLPLVEVRYMPATYPAATYIYKNKVAIILFNKTQLSVILIKNKEISKNFEEYFNFIWRGLK